MDVGEIILRVAEVTALTISVRYTLKITQIAARIDAKSESSSDAQSEALSKASASVKLDLGLDRLYQTLLQIHLSQAELKKQIEELKARIDGIDKPPNGGEK